MYSGIISEMCSVQKNRRTVTVSYADRYEQWLGVPSRWTLWHGQLGDLDVHLVVFLVTGVITASLTTATCTRNVPGLVHPRLPLDSSGFVEVGATKYAG